MKKISLLTLALGMAMMLSAQSFNNVSGSFAWAVGNESAPAASEEIAGALQDSHIGIGTDITAGTATYATANPNKTMATYYNTSASKPGKANSNMIEYKVKLQKGLTFKPTGLSLDLVKQGTDDASISWSYVLDGVESDTLNIMKGDIVRDSKTPGVDGAPALNHSLAIAATTGGREVCIRFYLSMVNSGKKIGFGNIQLTGEVNGTAIQRTFQDFTMELRDTATLSNLPAGVTLLNTPVYHGSQHGYKFANFSVAVDGPVRFKIGGCGYSNTDCKIYDGQTLLASINVKAAGCDNGPGTFDHFATYVYNSETPTTLTINGAEYCPYIIAEACDLIPLCYVTYYDADGRTVLAKDTVEGNSELVFKLSEADVTMPTEGYAFRGWFNSALSTGVKVAAGTQVQEDMALYAKVTPIEVCTQTARFVYDLTKSNFYMEDHECISAVGGNWHDNQHGWSFGNGGKIILPVAGKALVTVGNCRYSNDVLATVTNIAGTVIDTFRVKTPESADGQEYVVRYDGPADTLTITFGGTTYVHKVSVSNVVDFVEYDEATGYYIIPANDVNSFLLALTDANSTGNKKIFLPNGLYDLGETALTTISGNNISIIGESMEGTIIRNAPLVENEGIGTTATLYNTSTGLYLQDLTLQNALDYYHSASAGRAVCLQDKGTKTVCKNVRLLSYQDTYYPNKGDGEYYWETSDIHGTVDFICGEGALFMEKSTLTVEKRKLDGTGECTLTASSTAKGKNYGYVFSNCRIENHAERFNLGRAWNDEPRCAYINTTFSDNKIISSRWTKTGMNEHVVAKEFVEYNSTDTAGAVISPSSLVLTFVDKTGQDTLTYETILSANEAARFTVTNVFGEWAPDQIAAQVVPDTVYMTANGDLTWTGNAPAYLVRSNGKLEIVTGNSYPVEANASNVSVRAANGRGGFGPACGPGFKSALEQVKAEEMVKKCVENGQVVIVKDGVKYNVLGTVVR